MASLGATAAFLEATARVLTRSSSGTVASTEACAFGWELSGLLEGYRECVLELEARVSEEEEEAEAAAAAAKGSGNDKAKASSSSSTSSSSLPLPVPRIRLHLGEWPVVLEEVAALAELALECLDEAEEAAEKKRKKSSSSAVPPAAALARATAALSRCGAPLVEAAASRLSAAIERAQLLALSRWCSRGKGAGRSFWVVSKRQQEEDRRLEEEEEEDDEAEPGGEDPLSSFELVPAALPPFLSAEAARDALFVGCVARAFSSSRGRGQRSCREEEEGDGGDTEEEETRSALLSLLSSNVAAPGDNDSRLPTTAMTIRPTAVASALAAARERAERRLFRRSCRCFSSSPAAATSSSSGPLPPSSLLRAALESLRRVALIGDGALWGTALRSGYLRAALLLEKAQRLGGGNVKNVSSALEAAADDARGAATPAALEALFSARAPLRLSLVLLLEEPAKGGTRRGGRDEEEEEEEALWSRLRVRREGASAWPLGLLSPLFSSPARPSSDDPWRTVDSLFSTLLALERASLSLEEAYLSLRSAARERKMTLPNPCSSSAAAAAGNGSGAASETALLSLWRAHRDASFAVRGALSHLREDVLAPADRELDAALLRLQLQGAGKAGAGAAGPWTLAAAALGRWRSRVASSSLISSNSSGQDIAEALGKLCTACESIKSAVELASLLEAEDGEEEEEEDGNARSLAAASASALLGAAAAAGGAARGLAAAAAAEASDEVPVKDDGDEDDFAATHRAMLLGRVYFG